MTTNNDFLKKYSDDLFLIANAFRNKKPDYILGLTRKAPRLLELMRLSGIWRGDIPIISEKAIEFIPSEELKAKKIELANMERGKYFRIVARVYADGLLINDLMVQEGHAVKYFGGEKTHKWV